MQDDAGARKLADYQRQLSEHTRRLEQRKADMMHPLSGSSVND
jgi:hypothetical protein